MEIRATAFPVRVAALAAAIAAVAWPGAAFPGDDYASALLGERLRGDLYSANRTLPAERKVPRKTEPGVSVPRSWSPADQNPWANAYGVPSESMSRRPSVVVEASVWRPVRLCACYLPVETRSWDGGPLTDADIARLCRAQCN
jgi:hypothetical protein